MSTKHPMLEVRGVSKNYPRVRALRDVSFRLAPGEIGAVVGPNGAGKSTLLECLVGLQRVDSGEIRIAGYRVGATKERRKIARILGFVAQNSLMYQDLTVRENLQLHGTCHKLGNVSSQIEEIGERFSMSEYLDRPIRHCSTGVARRAALMRALVGESRLIVLDEPFANLDTQSRSVLWEMLEEFRGSERSVVLGSHDAEVIAELATRSIVLQAGRIEGT